MDRVEGFPEVDAEGVKVAVGVEAVEVEQAVEEVIELGGCLHL